MFTEKKYDSIFTKKKIMCYKYEFIVLLVYNLYTYLCMHN